MNEERKQLARELHYLGVRDPDGVARRLYENGWRKRTSINSIAMVEPRRDPVIILSNPIEHGWLHTF